MNTHLPMSLPRSVGEKTFGKAYAWKAAKVDIVTGHMPGASFTVDVPG